MKEELEEWEVRLVKDFDNIALDQFAKEQQKQQAKTKPKK